MRRFGVGPIREAHPLPRRREDLPSPSPHFRHPVILPQLPQSLPHSPRFAPVSPPGPCASSESPDFGRALPRPQRPRTILGSRVFGSPGLSASHFKSPLRSLASHWFLHQVSTSSPRPPTLNEGSFGQSEAASFFGPLRLPNGSLRFPKSLSS